MLFVPLAVVDIKARTHRYMLEAFVRFFLWSSFPLHNFPYATVLVDCVPRVLIVGVFRTIICRVVIALDELVFIKIEIRIVIVISLNSSSLSSPSTTRLYRLCGLSI